MQTTSTKHHSQNPRATQRRLPPTAAAGRSTLADERAQHTRARRIVYGASTCLAALAFAGIGIANLAHATRIMEDLTHLGYPAYFATIIGAWKVLAAVALLAPNLDRAKEWAYAGMFFTLTGAALSHAFNHDTGGTIAAPLVLLGVVMTSWRLGRPSESRECACSGGASGGEHHAGH